MFGDSQKTTVWSGRIWFWNAAKFREAGGITIGENWVLNPLSWWPWISYLIRPGGVINLGGHTPSAIELIQRARKAGIKTLRKRPDMTATACHAAREEALAIRLP